MSIKYNKKSTENEKKIKWHYDKESLENIITIIMTFIISLIAFEAINIDIKLYLSIAVAIVILIHMQYSYEENISFYQKVNNILTGNFVAYLFGKYCEGYWIRWDAEDICYILYAAFLTIEAITWRLKKRKIIQKQVHQNLDEKRLFRERRYDLKRLKDYLNIFYIIGVNAPWGAGKSFLVDQLRNDAYIIVKIDLLACNLDEIQTVLLNELNVVLKAEGIFSFFSPKLKKILKQGGIIQNIGQIFVLDDITYSEALTGFSEDLRKLDKTMLIIFEDLDRVDKPEIIKKILGISEKIANDKIKVIYQYDEHNLVERCNLDIKYLEKYIPTVVNLTDLSFSSILDYLFAEEKDVGLYLKREDFKFLELPIYPPASLKNTDMMISFDLKIPEVTIRKVQNFLKEIKIFTEREKIYREHKRETILFFMLKYFFHDSIYVKLSPEKKLEEIFTFSYEGKTNTISNWMVYCKSKKRDFMSIFSNDDNEISALMLSLFQYRCDTYITKNELREIVNEPVENLKGKNENEQMNRIVWNLLCNGKSEFTDQKVIIDYLQKKVLSKPLGKQKVAYEKLWQKIYYRDFKEDEKNDNTTIFRVAVPGMLSLFQANRVVCLSSAQWIQFLEFYFNYRKDKEIITAELIECLNYCDLTERKTFFYIIKKFNGFKIRGNVDRHKAYKIFLDEYLTALSSLGFIDTWEVQWIREYDDKKDLEAKEIEERVFNILKKKLEKLKKGVIIESVKRDINIIEAFLEKNKELMGAEFKIPEPDVKIKTKVESRLSHQQKVDELLKLNEEELDVALEEEYKKETLTAYEIKRIYEQRKIVK